MVARTTIQPAQTPPAGEAVGDRGTWLERQLVTELRAVRAEITQAMRGLRSEMRLFLVGLLIIALFCVAALAESRGVDSERAADAARGLLAPEAGP